MSLENINPDTISGFEWDNDRYVFRMLKSDDGDSSIMLVRPRGSENADKWAHVCTFNGPLNLSIGFISEIMTCDVTETTIYVLSPEEPPDPIMQGI